MSDIEHARQLLSMAARDLTALKGMADLRTFADEIFGFHAQQVVEKSLKAWITALGSDYPFIHDISALLARLEDLGCEVDHFWDLVELNAFAVQFRYETLDTAEVPLERLKLIIDVEKLFVHVSNVLVSSNP